MLPLAVALTLAATPVPMQAEPGNAACRDIDPGFVIYVPPATQDGLDPLLWLIGGKQPRAGERQSAGVEPQPLPRQRMLDLRSAIKTIAPAQPPPLCGRLVPVERPR